MFTATVLIKLNWIMFRENSIFTHNEGFFSSGFSPSPYAPFIFHKTNKPSKGRPLYEQCDSTLNPKVEYPSYGLFVQTHSYILPFHIGQIKRIELIWKIMFSGWRDGSAIERLLVLQKTWVSFPESRAGGSQQAVSPALGESYTLF